MRELKPEQPHPAAYSAKKFMLSLGNRELCVLREALASTAIEGNQTAEICGETLRRLMAGEPVGDRYVLGLAWFVRDNMGK